jgi:hypothetical protein
VIAVGLIIVMMHTTFDGVLAPVSMCQRMRELKIHGRGSRCVAASTLRDDRYL